MIKYKGFPVAPAEVESVLLEHPAVRDCGIVAKPDLAAGEIPCAFVVLREGFTPPPPFFAMAGISPVTSSVAMPTGLPKNSATSSPTAWPPTSSPAKFTS
jgi:acyl-CoA synthetase (AMP-forming)/AMP-acid ligase II